MLLHELAHLRRHDHWVRYLELVATCAYWWHPAAWWARSALREAEEQCCDAWVIWAMPAARRTYMTTLLDAVDFISEPVRPNSLAAPVLASGMGQFQHLQRRLTMVRERSVQRRLSGGGLAAVVLSAMALPLGPGLVRADTAPPAPPATDRPAPAPEAKPAPEPVTTESRAPTVTPTSPESSAPVPTSPYDSSGNSRIESLEAQVKAARAQIEALQKELAESKAALPPSAFFRAVRRDGTVVEVEPPQVAVVDPRAAANQVPQTPARDVTIRYNKGKLEEVTIPDERVVWSADVGPLESIEPAEGGKITVRTASGKWYVIGLKDGRILGELPPVMPAPRGRVFGTTGRVESYDQLAPEQPAPRGATTPARTEDRLDAIERKLNAVIEAIDRRGKLEADRATQLDRARDEAESGPATS